MNANFSRRDFFKGAGISLAGLGATAALAGCAPTDPEASAQGGELARTGDWLGTAPATAVEDCVSTIDCEVLVVGAALAGSMSAYGAVRNGAKVTMIERNSVAHVGGMEISFLNSKQQLADGVPEYNKIWVANTLFNQMQTRADMGLLGLWCERSGEVFDDLYENVLIPYNVHYSYDIIEDLFPDQAVELNQYISTGVQFSSDSDCLQEFQDALHAYLLDNGVDIQYSVRAEKLVQDEAGRVTGLIATRDGESVYYSASKGVIMCTGSFGANEEMMRHFYPKKFADFALSYNTYQAYMTGNVDEVLDDGIGHKMLCWAGAEIEEICSYQSWYNKGWMGFPFLQVNPEGNRFCNEAVSLLTSAHIVIDQPGATNFCWQIVPNSDYEMPHDFVFSYEFLRDAMGAFDGEHYEADTIEELADMMGVDRDNLVATVNRYNELCEKGEDTDFMKAPRYLDSIVKPPFTAWKLPYSFYCTTAGVRCSNSLEVLDADCKVIPGLYAAGNTVGYRYGSVYQTLIPGGTNALACTHGFVAGEAAACA